MLQYRSKVSWQSQLETRIPILDDLETRVSWYCQITFNLTCTVDVFENVKTNGDRELCILNPVYLSP